MSWTPGSKFTVATVDPLSEYQGARTEHSEDLPAPAVPVRNIALNKNPETNCGRIRDECFRLNTKLTDEKSTAHQLSAEILVVGNELLNGTTLDTNSHWMSQELTSLGVKVNRKTTVRDELLIISSAFAECASRKPDWLFSIGGLGPTYDDMTIEAVAKFLGKPLYLDPKAAQMLKESYVRRRKMFNRPITRMPKSSLKMAMIPQGSTPLYNSVGSAAGVLARFRQTNIASFPGVPSEMKAIFTEEIVPMIKKESTQFVNAEEWIELIGTSESRLAPIVSRISSKYSPILYIKSHPMGFEKGKSIIDVQIIMTTTKENERDALRSLEQATQEMNRAAKRLGAIVKKLKSVR
jgi:nicotinamide-nucleotide amidase